MKERERERESERERGTTNGGVYLKYTERGLGKKLKRERQSRESRKMMRELSKDRDCSVTKWSDDIRER